MNAVIVMALISVVGALVSFLSLVFIARTNERRVEAIRIVLKEFVAKHPALGHGQEHLQLLPYRTPATVDVQPVPVKKNTSPCIVAWSDPMTPTCPKCGRSWNWINHRPYCECSACEVGHFHQACRSRVKGETLGCGANWIVRAKDGSMEA